MKRDVVRLAASVVAMTVGFALPGAAVANQHTGAGCYLPVPEGVFMGLNRSTGTIQLPMGRREPGETLRQTAARETREETGVDVTVGGELLSLNNQQVVLYLCQARYPIGPYTQLAPLDTGEVSEVLVIDPHTLRNFDGRQITDPWRFPQTRFLLRMLFSPKALQPAN